MAELKEVLNQIVDMFSDSKPSKMGIVKNVDVDARTCTVLPLELKEEDPDLVIYDVMFQAGGSATSGVTLIPKEGSLVMISFMDDDSAFLSLMSEAEKVSIKSDTEDLKAILTDMLSAIEQLTVTTTTGPSSPPINLTAFSLIKTRLNNLFE